MEKNFSGELQVLGFLKDHIFALFCIDILCIRYIYIDILSIKYISIDIIYSKYICGLGRELLDDTDSRVAYYSSAFLLKARLFSISISTLYSIQCQFCNLLIHPITDTAENDDRKTREIPAHATESCV